MKRKLFISATFILQRIAQGKITDDDLATGLFFLNYPRERVFAPICTRSSAFALSANDHWRFTPIYEKFLAALSRAEDEGRCFWLPGSMIHTLFDLSDWLKRLGLSALPRCHDGRFHGVELIDLIRETDLPLEVVYL